MTSEVKMAGISSLPISKIIETLTNCYVSLIKANLEIKSFPSVMLWGQPGSGKSQSVKEIAENIKKMTGKSVFVEDVRLLLYNPIDLRGIPVADDKKTKAVWLTPEVFQLNPSDDVINILLLDEISAAPQSVQAAAYQLVLDRKVGEHTLPDNTIIIAAGNRITDKSVAFKMPKALANRFLHFEVTTSFETWKEWAIRKGIHPLIMGFLAFRPDLLNTFDTGSDSLAFATPRSWELVSNILNNISDNINSVYHLISGLVGIGVATELRSWFKIYSKLPKIEDVLNGKVNDIPTDSSAIFALSCSILKQFREKKLKDEQIINAIKYGSKFPKEFFLMLISESIIISDEIKQIMVTEPEIVSVLGEKARIINGQVNNGYFKRKN